VLKDTSPSNADKLERGDEQELNKTIENYKKIRDIAPQKQKKDWDILIDKTNESIKEINSQTLDNDNAGDTKYLDAYKRIVDDFDKNCK
jgi:hypothetical protein